MPEAWLSEYHAADLGAGSSGHWPWTRHNPADRFRTKESGTSMAKLALYVPLEAKAGKEEEAADFLRSALAMAEEEPGTTTWYALRFDRNTFAIFDAFPDEAARDAHLAGKVAVSLIQNAPDLFVDPPEIQRVEILAYKPHRAA
jgi:quinol monooxygenase YgiN